MREELRRGFRSAILVSIDEELSYLRRIELGPVNRDGRAVSDSASSVIVESFEPLP